MRIAGISIDPENLPIREDLLKLALSSAKYDSNPNAEAEVNQEIDKSGLFTKKSIKLAEENKETDGLHRTATEKFKPRKFGK